MHQILAYSAFGWLTLSGLLHFIADVVSQHLRGKRVPGLETDLFYGMHTAYALGQVLFGILALIVVRYARPLLDQWQVKALCFTAFCAWAIFAFVFIEYWEPKLNLGIFGILLVFASIKRS